MQIIDLQETLASFIHDIILSTNMHLLTATLKIAFRDYQVWHALARGAWTMVAWRNPVLIKTE